MFVRCLLVLAVLPLLGALLGPPAAAQNVWVNFDLILKVDGQKFFPIGLVELGIDRYPDDWNDRIRSSGANLVWDSGVTYLHEEISCEAVRDSAEAAGYHLLLGSPDTWEWDVLETPEFEVAQPMYEADSLASMLECFDSSDRLIALANRDEPIWSVNRGVLGDIDSLHIVDTYDQLRAASPNRVVAMNFAPVHASENLATWMADIIGFVPSTKIVLFASYPYPAGPGTCNPINVVGYPECSLDRLPDSADLFLGSINQANQPLWMVVQAFKGIPLMEARWEAHVSIIRRATGLLWAGWTWSHPQGGGPANWPVIEQVISEMSSLHDVLIRNDRGGVSSLHPDLDVRAKSGTEDDTVIFAASRRGANGLMAIDVEDLESDWAEVLWEYRWVPIVNGVIEDHFEEYESHVYHVIPDSDPPTSAPVLEGAVDQFSVRVFPNPSSGTVRAFYRRPESESVWFDVYDVAGRKITDVRPSDGPGTDGHIVWDGRGVSGRPVPAGIYFLRGQTSGGRTATARIIRR